VAIDVELYLTDIAADNVCGEDLEYDAEFIAFEQEIQGKEEKIMGDSVIEAEPPNWREVIKQAEKLLARTRDMRIYVNYLRALTETQGVSGFSDGMLLLRKACEKYWENIHPQLDPDDDNDPTERINILMELCDFESFLSPIHKIPLVESKALGRFNLRDIQIANGSISVAESDNAEELPQLATIEGAFQECDPEILKATANAALASLQDLDKIELFVTEQVGVSNAPSFAELSTLLKDINKILAEQLEKRGLNETTEEGDGSENAEQTGTAKSAKSTVSSGINSNQDVIKALNLICDYYKKNEPASPIPLLLERVIRLVGKNFMEVMHDLAPGGVEQVEFLSGLKNKDQ
jgi:type VI secretion system protein ImpA